MGRRTALFLVAVVVALSLLGGTALALTYTTSKKASLKLNKTNGVATALTALASNATGAALTLQTDDTDSASTPLSLDTETASQAPMKVDSETKVDKLNADKLDGMEPNQLPGTIASIATIHSFPGIPFDLGTSSAGWKFVGAPATNITTTSSQQLVGSAAVPLGDPTATSINYDLCYRPSGGTTLTAFTGGSSATLTPYDVVYTASSTVKPGAGTWDVGFCVQSAVNDARDAERTSYVNGWVQVVNQ